MLPTDSAPTPRPGGWKTAGWLGGVIVAFAVVTGLAEWIAFLLELTPIGSALCVQVSIFLLPLAFAAADGGGVRSLGLAGSFHRRDIGIVLGLVFLHLVGSTVTSLYLTFLGVISTEGSPASGVFSTFGSLDLSQFVLIWIGMVFLSGMGEEMLFRGYLITRMEQRGLSATTCVVLSALLFGLVHWPGYGLWLALSKALWFGIPTGIYFWKRRSLWPLVAIHMVVNGVGFGLLYLVQRFAM